MILIGESGATKTDWRLLGSGKEIIQARTQGLNPYHMSFEEIREGIYSQLHSSLNPKTFEETGNIYFYGAGCASEEACEKLSRALQFSFPKAVIYVFNDLLAAARALCGHDPGIACILGTGSNSCLYDGEKIIKNIPPLGYVIADEGSGAHLGKQLLADFFREDMPTELREKFNSRFGTDRAAVLDNVYNKEKPGRYLAGFTKFIFDNIKSEYMHQLVYSAFDSFFRKNVLKYDGYSDYKVHFTGGVAFYFNQILREVGGDRKVTIGKIVENPISGLTLYHQGM